MTSKNVLFVVLIMGIILISGCISESKINETKVPEKPTNVDQILYDEIVVGKLWPDNQVSIMIETTKTPSSDLTSILESKHKARAYNVVYSSKIIGAEVTANEVFKIATYDWVKMIYLDAKGDAKPHSLVIDDRWQTINKST